MKKLLFIVFAFCSFLVSAQSNHGNVNLRVILKPVQILVLHGNEIEANPKKAEVAKKLQIVSTSGYEINLKQVKRVHNAERVIESSTHGVVDHDIAINYGEGYTARFVSNDDNDDVPDIIYSIHTK